MARPAPLNPSLLLCASVLGFALAPMLAAARPRPVSAAPVVIPRSEQFDLATADGKRTYRVMVATPAPPAGSMPAPAAGYPVVYVLDGNANFGTWTEAARVLERSYGPCVVVGIGYPIDGPFDQPRRNFDFTPVTPPEKVRRMPTDPVPKVGDTGGNDEFLKFIQERVKPAVEQRVKVDRSKQSLFGHSLGGLFVLHVLFTQPEAFQTYLPVSPSIWWKDRSVLQEERAFLERAKGQRLNARVFFQVGELEQKPEPGLTAARLEFLNQARMVDSSREMAERLNALSGQGLRAQFKVHEGESHGTVIAPSIGRALGFALSGKP